METKAVELLQEVSKKLSVVIALLANPVKPAEGKISARDQIALLNRYGLTSSEIASVLNKSPNYVSKELSLLKGNK